MERVVRRSRACRRERSLRMRWRPITAFLALLLAALAASGQDGFIKPNANLVLDGMPALPADVMKKVAPYASFRPSRLASWHPKRREMLVLRSHGGTRQ